MPDKVFSSKAMGDGFAVQPQKGEVYSQVEGIIKAGQLLLKFDIKNIKAKVPSTDIIVILTSGESCEVLKNGEKDIVNISVK